MQDVYSRIEFIILELSINNKLNNEHEVKRVKEDYSEDEAWEYSKRKS